MILFVDVFDSVDIMLNELFGFVVVIVCFDNFDDVVEKVNCLFFGLVVFVFIENGCCVNMLGDVIESGMVGINMFVIFSYDVLFGGVKDLGFGSEGGSEGLDSY